MPEIHPERSNQKRPIEDDQHEKHGDGVSQEGLPARKKRLAHRGTRSKKAHADRLRKYVDSGGPERARKVINNLTGMNYQCDQGIRLITKIEIHHPSHYPDDFVNAKKDQQMVRTTISKEYPDARHPENLHVVPLTRNGILKVPTPKYKLSLDPDHPPYLILRLDLIVSVKKQWALLAAWDQVQAASPQHYIKREQARSTTPAYHWGIWEVTAPAPYITRESKDQTAEAILAIDKLLGLVKELMVPKIIQMMKEYLPVQWKHQER
jgi:hypothetical protein